MYDLVALSSRHVNKCMGGFLCHSIQRDSVTMYLPSYDDVLKICAVVELKEVFSLTVGTKCPVYVDFRFNLPFVEFFTDRTLKGTMG